MNFVHLSILAGLATVAIPMVLHLLGKRQPQLIDFPALRFVRQTTEQHSKSWQLRHMLLLLLRILLFAVLVFALARPRVHSALLGSMIGISGLIILAVLATLAAAIAWASRRPLTIWGTAAVLALLLWIGTAIWAFRALTSGPALPTSDSTAPVAVALILDTGPTMNYVAQNQSRLEAAKEMALWLLNRLPVDSHVGILSGVPIGSLAQSPPGAVTQIERITKTTERVNLVERLKSALDLVLKDPLDRREIYILTDMNASSWGTAQPDLLELIQQVKDQVLIQIIDVGSDQQLNWQLGDPELDSPTVAVGSSISVKIPVTQLTQGKQPDAAIAVELWQEAIDPRLPVISGGQMQLPPSSVVARQLVNFAADGTAQVELVAKSLSEGVHHFRIKLDKSDPLSIDNQRFFSVTVQRLQPTLVVANNTDAANVLSLVIDPSGDPASPVTKLTFAQLPSAVLERYSTIVLYDPGSLAEPLVKALREHVQGGGGLMVILGRSLELAGADLSRAPIAQLLPGVPNGVAVRPTTDRQSFWNPSAASHPVYQDLETPATEVAWQLMPIFRNWTFAAVDPSAQVLADLSSNQAPLLLLQNVGQGQILTLTTPLPEFEQPRDQLWNELWVSEQFWWAYGILSGSLRTLSGANQSPLTFVAGSAVTLANDNNQWPKYWELYTPSAERISLEANNGLLTTGRVTEPGNYHLRGNRGAAVARGFSVNIPAADTVLAKIQAVELDGLLGHNNYGLATKREEIESSVGQARYGRELYPLLMLFVAAIFLAEQVMSNRFYKIQLRVGKATT